MDSKLRWVGLDGLVYAAPAPSLIRKLFTLFLRFGERSH